MGRALRSLSERDSFPFGVQARLCGSAASDLSEPSEAAAAISSGLAHARTRLGRGRAPGDPAAHRKRVSGHRHSHHASLRGHSPDTFRDRLPSLSVGGCHSCLGRFVDLVLPLTFAAVSARKPTRAGFAPMCSTSPRRRPTSSGDGPSIALDPGKIR